MNGRSSDGSGRAGQFHDDDDERTEREGAFQQQLQKSEHCRAVDEEAREYCVGKQKKRKDKTQRGTAKKAKEKSEEEYVGPDTSSLTAFLISLLSLSEPSGGDNEDEKSSDGSEFEEEASCSRSNLAQGKPDLELDAGLEFVVEPSGSDKEGKQSSPSTSAGADDFDADWQIVSEKDLMSSRLVSEAPSGQLAEKTKGASAKPAQLPDMSEQSSLLLSESLRGLLHAALPTLAKGRKWVLLYSTLRHGISLRTLYRKSGLIPGPCLLVAGDRAGAVFGGLVSAPLKPTPKKKYQGTSDSFVFTNVGGTPQIFRSTGFNRYFVLCTNDAIAFGGGGHFALHLDSELLYGTSAACETFGNAGLATTEDFVLKDVELWGFAHASRYLSRRSSYTEPEIVRGIYSW